MNEKVNYVWIPQVIKLDEIHKNERFEITRDEEYEFRDENGNVINAQKIVLEKKKKEYPKTYAECCDTLSVCSSEHTSLVAAQLDLPMNTFIRLLVARDAYWKLYGEEMGLDEPWEPDWTNGNQKKYCIYNDSGAVQKGAWNFCSAIFAFPTEEMRDAFKENFNPDIEICKELL